MTTATEVTATTTWNIDPVHSHAEFKVRHMMISNVKGEFKGVTGTLKLNREDLTKSGVEVSIDAATVQHRRRAARCAPEERRLLRRGEIPDSDFQIESRLQEQQGWSAYCCGRTHHPWRDSQRRI